MLSSFTEKIFYATIEMGIVVLCLSAWMLLIYGLVHMSKLMFGG